MVETSQEWIVERFAQLETENRRLARRVRWLARTGLASLLGLLVSAAGGAAMLANPDIRPGRIIVRDPGNSGNGVMIEAAPDSASIILFGKNDFKRVHLSAGSSGQFLSINDAKGQTLLKLP